MKNYVRMVSLLLLLLNCIACSPPRPPQPELVSSTTPSRPATPTASALATVTQTPGPADQAPANFLYLKEDRQMWLADLDGKDQRFIADWSQSDNLIPYDYDVAPDQRQVVMLLGANNTRLLPYRWPPSLEPWQLHLLDLQTGAHQLLLASSDLAEQSYIGTPVRWSPQGETIAYVRSGDIWFFDPESHETRQVTQLLIPDDVPARAAANQWDVGVMDFVWSPDGRQIALEVGRLWGSGIRWVGLLDISSGEVQAFTPEGSDTAYGPVWAPEGKLSWIERSEADETQVVVIYDIQTGQETPVEETRSEALTGVTWSQAGSFLAFSSFEEGYYSVRVFDPELPGIVFEQTGLSPDSAEMAWLNDEVLIYRCSPVDLCRWVDGQGAPQPIITDGYIPTKAHILVEE